MKKAYSTPNMTVHGNVSEITQVTGTSSRRDFAFLNGQIVSENDDLGSRDICSGSPKPAGANCDPRFP